MAPATEAKRKRGKTAPYRGVRRRQSGKYVAELRLPRKNKCIWIGTFNSAIAAAKAYDAAAIEHIGTKAITNFPIPKTQNKNVVLQTPTTTTLNSSAPPPTTNPTSPNYASTIDNQGPSGFGSSSALVVDDAGKKPLLDIDLNRSPPD